MQDVVLVIPMCEGPIRKAFETAGVTTQVVGSTHLNDIARVEPENGFDGALVDATSLAFNAVSYTHLTLPTIYPV